MAVEGQDIVAEFAVESQEHLANIENELLAIEEGGANIDVELVNKVFRSVHSIKGASGFLGFTTVGELSHGMENVLNLLRNRELVPDAVMTDVLLKAADALRGLMANIEHSNGTDVRTHIEALRKIIDRQMAPAERAHVDDAVEFAGPDGIVLRTTQLVLQTHQKLGHHLYIIDFDLLVDADAKNRTPLALIRELLMFGELLESYIPTEQWGGLENEPPSKVRYVVLVGSILEDSGFLVSALGLRSDQVTLATPIVQPVAKVAEQPPPTPEPQQPATPVLTPSEPAGEATRPSSGPEDKAAPEASKPTSESPAETSIRVSVSLLDHLMNLAGELVLGRNQLMQMIAAKSQSGLDSVGARLNQVTSELQEAIMQTRMQPIGSVFGKFPRVVRDLSAKLGKQCDLTIEGKDVELDKSLVEIITDPLTHLVRNSIDHGIEMPHVRTGAGKAAIGRISLKAFHQAGKVNISITDDGAGIDAERLKKKALDKGLITATQAREMGERDALRLIFLPGFSLAERVTDVSGRGVGMDVVRTNIQKAGGTVEIDTEVGAGTTISVKLPLTLAIIPSLIVRCGAERFAIPQVSISELVRIKASEITKKIERVSGAEVLRLRGSLLPLLRLSRVMKTQSPRLDSVAATLEDNKGETPVDPQTAHASSPSREANLGAESDRRGDPKRGALNVIVVETGHLRYGLIVDGLHDSEEIVVKPLGSHLKGTSCLAGATILGDGHVALILDIAGLAAYCQLSVPADDDSDKKQMADAEAGRDAQTLLLFNNGSSEQFGVPMGLISRLERIRAEQIDSVGGQAVLQYRGSSLPLLNLEHHIKVKHHEQSTVYVIVFRVGRQEVGLIVPNLVDIRDVNADIDPVTFREPGVMGSVVIDSKTTRLIDLFELARSAHPEWFGNVAAVEEQKACGQAHILLAEDSGFFRKQLQDVLTDEGYMVTACEDGAVAWNTLQEADPPISVVVTDIEMPNLDGYELTRKIKGDPRFAKLPVIAVTSLAGQEDVARGTAAGVDCYQVKLDRDQLMQAVAKYVTASGQQSGSHGERELAQTRRS